MPPKKKAENTENIVEEVPVEPEETMEAPKPKRKLSEAQKKNFEKLQAANKIRYEARRKAKEELGEPVKDKSKNVNDEILNDKEAFIQKEINKKKTEVRKVKKQIEQIESDEEAEVQVIKKQRKKKKPRIIVEDDSSDSEQEIVISRRRRNKKPVVAASAPIDIPTNHNDAPQEKQSQSVKDEDTGPIEKEKKEKKPLPELKEYTHLQILKGLGL